ncbi:MAG: hypothetical protein R2939_14615 [Kofleriaceae bacterium]
MLLDGGDVGRRRLIAAGADADQIVRGVAGAAADQVGRVGGAIGEPALGLWRQHLEHRLAIAGLGRGKQRTHAPSGGCSPAWLRPATATARATAASTLAAAATAPATGQRERHRFAPTGLPLAVSSVQHQRRAGPRRA